MNLNTESFVISEDEDGERRTLEIVFDAEHAGCVGKDLIAASEASQMIGLSLTGCVIPKP